MSPRLRQPSRPVAFSKILFKLAGYLRQSLREVHSVVPDEAGNLRKHETFVCEVWTAPSAEIAGMTCWVTRTFAQLFAAADEASSKSGRSHPR